MNSEEAFSVDYNVSFVGGDAVIGEVECFD